MPSFDFYAFTSVDSSVNFLPAAMARIKSTTRPIGATTGSGGEGHESEGSVKRIESVLLSDTGSRSGVGDDVDDGSHNRRYYFGPLTVTVSRIHGMIDNGYFFEGMGHEPGVETIPEPNANETVVFEEFFTAGLRMPPQPMLVDILLKFQVQIHQLTPNAIVQLSKYIWAVTGFGGILSAEGFTKMYELHYQPRKIEVDGVEVQGQYKWLNFHVKHGSQ
jgi:hypothetical protein